MGLTRNNLPSGNPGRVFGLAQGAFARDMFDIISNAATFGQITSVPQGYNNQNALRMTVKVGGNISARFLSDATYTANIQGIGNMTAAILAEIFWAANGNVGANGYGLFDGEFTLDVEIGAIGAMAANMDLLARPSANDIAQEVWNSQAAAFVAPGTFGAKVTSTEKAAKLSVAVSA